MIRHAIFQISHADGNEWVDYSRIDFDESIEAVMHLKIFTYCLKEAASIAAGDLDITPILRARVEDWNEEGITPGGAVGEYTAPPYYISPFRDPGDGMLSPVNHL
jgi:hypothetical protein